MFDNKHDIREVRVRVREVSRSDADIIRACIGALRRPRVSCCFLDARRHIVEVVVRRDGLVAGDGLFRAVIGVGLAVLGDGDSDLFRNGVDGQRAVVGFGDDVLASRINRADRAVCEIGRIRAGIRAGRADADGGEVSRVLALGEAADGLLAAIVGVGLAVRGQGDVLIIVEGNDIFGVVRGDGDGLAVVGNSRVALNRRRRFGHRRVVDLRGHRLAVRNGRGGAVEVIVDGVAEVAALGVGNFHGDVLCGHGAADHFLIGHIAGNRRRGHGIILTVGHFIGVGVFCRLFILVNIVHGEGEDILLVIDVDDVQVLIRANGQGQFFRLRLVQHVAVGALIGVVRYLRAIGGRAVLLKLRLQHAVQIVIHIVVVVIGGIVEGD